MPTRKSEKTANSANIKKQLEALTGHKINSSEQLVKVLRNPLGAYDYTDGSAAWRWIFWPQGKTCSDATLLDVSGVSFTGADGTRVFLLSDFVCFSNMGVPLRSQSMWLPLPNRLVHFSLRQHTR